MCGDSPRLCGLPRGVFYSVLQDPWVSLYQLSHSDATAAPAPATAHVAAAAPTAAAAAAAAATGAAASSLTAPTAVTEFPSIN